MILFDHIRRDLSVFVFYCAEFNKAGGCNLQDRHDVLFKGKTLSAWHICGSCWTKDKKKEHHASCSGSCPHNN